MEQRIIPDLHLINFLPTMSLKSLKPLSSLAAIDSMNGKSKCINDDSQILWSRMGYDEISMQLKQRHREQEWITYF